jgi:hypothetical protein
MEMELNSIILSWRAEHTLCQLRSESVSATRGEVCLRSVPIEVHCHAVLIGVYLLEIIITFLEHFVVPMSLKIDRRLIS